MKFTASQIKEFAKMGYSIDENGNLTKEVRIQKLIRTSVATQTMKNIELSETTVKVQRDIDRKSPVIATKVNFRVQEEWLDPERLVRGLVTARQKGVDYSLLPDNTKVCRCCQKRKDGSKYSKATANKDGKMNICKSCDNTRLKSYNAEMKLKKAA